MALSVVALPLYNYSWFVYNPFMTSKQVYALMFRLPKVLYFFMGAAIIFLIYNQQWIVAVSLETLLSLNPFFAVCMVWLK